MTATLQGFIDKESDIAIFDDQSKHRTNDDNDDGDDHESN